MYIKSTKGAFLTFSKGILFKIKTPKGAITRHEAMLSGRKKGRGS